MEVIPRWRGSRWSGPQRGVGWGFYGPGGRGSETPEVAGTPRGGCAGRASSSRAEEPGASGTKLFVKFRKRSVSARASPRGGGVVSPRPREVTRAPRAPRVRGNAAAARPRGGHRPVPNPRAPARPAFRARRRSSRWQRPRAPRTPSLPRGPTPAGGSPQYQSQRGSDAIPGAGGPAAQAPLGAATCAARTLGAPAGCGPGGQVRASRLRPTAARALAPPREPCPRPASPCPAPLPAPPSAPSPRPLPAAAALPPGCRPPPRRRRSWSSTLAPVPLLGRSPSRRGVRGEVAGPFLSRGPIGTARGGLRGSSGPPGPRGHPPGASVPGQLHPRPSWKWEAAGRGKGRARAGTRRGEPSGGAHRWAPLPPGRCAGRLRPGTSGGGQSGPAYVS